MKTVEETSQIYVNNLLDLYCRVFLLKENMHLLGTLGQYGSKISSEFIVDNILSTIEPTIISVFSELNKNIKEYLLRNFLHIVNNIKALNSNISPINISDVEIDMNHVDFEQQKFKNTYNIEKYIIVEDTDINDENFQNRQYFYKNKVNSSIFYYYVENFLDGQYKKYFKSIKMGARLNFIIKEEDFKGKFLIEDLKQETSNYREKNWILFHNNFTDFIFSIELSKTESVNLATDLNSDELLGQFINANSYEIYDERVNTILMTSNQIISETSSSDVSEIISYIKNDINNQTIKNVLEENKDFNSLCSDILALIKKYQNYKELN